MVDVEYTPRFRKAFGKIKHKALRKKVQDLVRKIIDNPFAGKPMRYDRKGTRELYVEPYRLAYAFENNTIYFLSIYHKDKQ